MEWHSDDFGNIFKNLRAEELNEANFNSKAIEDDGNVEFKAEFAVDYEKSLVDFLFVRTAVQKPVSEFLIIIYFVLIDFEISMF